jgi:hypothetical protein
VTLTKAALRKASATDRTRYRTRVACAALKWCIDVSGAIHYALESGLQCISNGCVHGQVVSK